MNKNNKVTIDPQVASENAPTIKKPDLIPADSIVDKSANAPMTWRRFAFLISGLFVFFMLMTFYVISIALLFMKSFSTTNKILVFIPGFAAFVGQFFVYLYLYKKLNK